MFGLAARYIKQGGVGSLYNGGGVVPNLALQRVAVEQSRLGIPLIFGAQSRPLLFKTAPKSEFENCVSPSTIVCRQVRGAKHVSNPCTFGAGVPTNARPESSICNNEV